MRCLAYLHNKRHLRTHPMALSITYLSRGLGVHDLSQQLLPISTEDVGAPAQQSHIPTHQL